MLIDACGEILVGFDKGSGGLLIVDIEDVGEALFLVVDAIVFDLDFVDDRIFVRLDFEVVRANTD